MPHIVPAILSRDPKEIEDRIDFLNQFKELSRIQIDFADGKFVPNELVYPSDLPPLETHFHLEAHLMMQTPQRYLNDLWDRNIRTVYLHHESFGDDSSLYSAIGNAKHIGFECGIAFNPHTPIESFERFSEHIGLILILGVDPGFQGQEFQEETFDRIRFVRERYPDVTIAVDGGIKIHNVEAVIAHGADLIAVGSGIWQNPDPVYMIEQFLAKVSHT